MLSASPATGELEMIAVDPAAQRNRAGPAAFRASDRGQGLVDDPLHDGAHEIRGALRPQPHRVGREGRRHGEQSSR